MKKIAANRNYRLAKIAASPTLIEFEELKKAVQEADDKAGRANIQARSNLDGIIRLWEYVDKLRTHIPEPEEW